MVFERTKPHIVLNPKQKSYLEKIAKSGKSEKREYDRARIILMDAEGKGVNTIARELHTNRTKVYLTIDKALSFGVEKAIKDLSGRGKKRTIGNEGRSFIIKTACTKPSDLGYPHEIWTNRLLTKYIRENAPEEYNLGNISNGTVSKILTRSNIRPYKIRYYIVNLAGESCLGYNLTTRQYQSAEVMIHMLAIIPLNIRSTAYCKLQLTNRYSRTMVTLRLGILP